MSWDSPPIKESGRLYLGCSSLDHGLEKVHDLQTIRWGNRGEYLICFPSLGPLCWNSFIYFILFLSCFRLEGKLNALYSIFSRRDFSIYLPRIFLMMWCISFAFVCITTFLLFLVTEPFSLFSWRTATSAFQGTQVAQTITVTPHFIVTGWACYQGWFNHTLCPLVTMIRATDWDGRSNVFFLLFSRWMSG